MSYALSGVATVRAGKYTEKVELGFIYTYKTKRHIRLQPLAGLEMQ
jgi:hypothetical protein